MRIPIPKPFTTVHTVHGISFNKRMKNKRGAKARDIFSFIHLYQEWY